MRKQHIYHVNPLCNKWEEENHRKAMLKKIQGAKSTLPGPARGSSPSKRPTSSRPAGAGVAYEQQQGRGAGGSGSSEGEEPSSCRHEHAVEPLALPPNLDIAQLDALIALRLRQILGDPLINRIQEQLADMRGVDPLAVGLLGLASPGGGGIAAPHSAGHPQQHPHQHGAGAGGAGPRRIVSALGPKHAAGRGRGAPGAPLARQLSAGQQQAPGKPPKPKQRPAWNEDWAAPPREAIPPRDVSISPMATRRLGAESPSRAAPSPQAHAGGLGLPPPPLPRSGSTGRGGQSPGPVSGAAAGTKQRWSDADGDGDMGQRAAGGAGAGPAKAAPRVQLLPSFPSTPVSGSPARPLSSTRYGPSPSALTRSDINAIAALNPSGPAAAMASAGVLPPPAPGTPSSGGAGSRLGGPLAIMPPAGPLAAMALSPGAGGYVCTHKGGHVGVPPLVPRTSSSGGGAGDAASDAALVSLSRLSPAASPGPGSAGGMGRGLRAPSAGPRHPPHVQPHVAGQPHTSTTVQVGVVATVHTAEAGQQHQQQDKENLKRTGRSVGAGAEEEDEYEEDFEDYEGSDNEQYDHNKENHSQHHQGGDKATGASAAPQQQQQEQQQDHVSGLRQSVAALNALVQMRISAARASQQLRKSQSQPHATQSRQLGVEPSGMVLLGEEDSVLGQDVTLNPRMLGTAPGDSLRHSRSSRAGAGGQGPASDPLGGTQALMGGDAEFGASCDLIGGGDGPGGVLRDSDLEYLERLGAGGTALLYGGKAGAEEEGEEYEDDPDWGDAGLGLEAGVPLGTGQWGDRQPFVAEPGQGAAGTGPSHAAKQASAAVQRLRERQQAVHAAQLQRLSQQRLSGTGLGGGAEAGPGLGLGRLSGSGGGAAGGGAAGAAPAVAAGPRFSGSGGGGNSSSGGGAGLVPGAGAATGSSTARRSLGLQLQGAGGSHEAAQPAGAPAHQAPSAFGTAAAQHGAAAGGPPSAAPVQTPAQGSAGPSPNLGANVAGMRLSRAQAAALAKEAGALFGSLRQLHQLMSGPRGPELSPKADFRPGRGFTPTNLSPSPSPSGPHTGPSLYSPDKASNGGALARANTAPLPPLPTMSGGGSPSGGGAGAGSGGGAAAGAAGAAGVGAQGPPVPGMFSEGAASGLARAATSGLPGHQQPHQTRASSHQQEYAAFQHHQNQQHEQQALHQSGQHRAYGAERSSGHASVHSSQQRRSQDAHGRGPSGVHGGTLLGEASPVRQAVEDDQDDEDAVVIGTMGWGGTGLLGGAAASSSCEETGDESSCPPVLEEGTTGELEQGSGLDQSSSGPEGPPLPSGSGSGTSSTSHATASAMHGTSRRGAALITPRTAAAHALVPHDVAWMAGLMQTLSQSLGEDVWGSLRRQQEEPQADMEGLDLEHLGLGTDFETAEGAGGTNGLGISSSLLLPGV